MEKKIILLFKCAVGILSFMLVSCNDVDLANISEDVQIKESLVLPLAEGNVSIQDILNQIDMQDNISIDADTINFVTQINKEYEFADVDFLQNEVAQTINFPLIAAVIPANTNLPASGTNEFQLDLGLDPNSAEKRIDSARVSSATFEFTLSVADITVLSSGMRISPSDLIITIEFPKMHYYDSSASISKDITVNQYGRSSSFELTNFVAETAGLTGIPFQIKIKSGNRDIKIGANGVIDVDFSITQLTYEVAYGMFELVSKSDQSMKMSLDFLSDLPEGLRFVNPRAMITLESNIGAFLRFNIDYVRAYTKDGSTIKQALFDGSTSTSEGLDLKPTIPGSFITKNMRTLDKDYGTTDQLFDTSDQLDTLEYKFSFLNDELLNNKSTTPCFIIPGMKIKATVNVKIPFYLKKGSNISITDSLTDINAEVLENVDSATLILKVTNGLPAKGSFSMKFLNESHTVIAASFNNSNYLINSGQVSDSGLVISSAITSINIKLTKEDAVRLQDAKSMVYTILAEGQDETKQIQFTKDNFINVKLGAYINGNYTGTLDLNN